MKKFTLCLSLISILVVLLSINLHSQQCEVLTTNVIFEADNSLTFDVYIKNSGPSDWTYSHGSFAWTYDPAFLNGGTPSFTLVPGFSDFASTAQPPSALLSSPSIMRTSSNLPGSNGVILAGQSLRLYRFRLQTSALSFTGNYLPAAWKTVSTPYTRVFIWNSGTGLPEENLNLTFNIESILFEENFDYAVGDSLNGLNGWVVQPVASYVNTIKVVSPGLTYPDYAAIGNSVKIDTTGQDIYHQFVTQSSGSIYAAFLVNITKATATGEYFLHFTDPPGSTTFKARVYAKLSGSDIVFGLLGKGSTTTNTIYTTTTYPLNTTHLMVLKYTFNPSSTTDDSVFLFINPTVGGPESAPDISFGSTDADFTACGAVNLRQGSASSAPRLILDGIRIGNYWTDILPLAGNPAILTSPSALSGFSYLAGSGPSESQSYNLSGLDLEPLSGNISVTGSLNYEVSLDDVIFGSSVDIPYVGGVLASTPVYVRLKADLPSGIYNGEMIVNAGGGAVTANVVCNGSVTKPEPTNHVTNFSGSPGIPQYAAIELSWLDATGSAIPDGYLIKGSTINFDTISAPIDGTPVSNGFLVYNVTAGIQNHQFTALNGGRTYYFKIFPYTNSGSIIDYKVDGTIPQVSATTLVPPSLPVVESFNYATGSLLTENGWLAHSAAGTNPLTILASPLIYPGYFLSDVGKSVSMATSGEDANRAFDSIKTGSVYGSFLVNVTSAQLAGDYFFHFGLENNTSLFFGRVFVKDSSGSIGFGVAKTQTTAAVYTPCIYSPGTTYLIVVKYTFQSGTNKDDEAKLWVNPILDGVEPPSNVTATDTLNDALALGMLALRQGGTASASVLSIGGIRVANSWLPASGTGSTLNLTAFVEGFWNGTTMVNDNLTVELRNSASPYTLVEQQNISVNSAGSGSGIFYEPLNDVPYYIVLKHRNSIETWSAVPQQFTAGSLNYDFSTSAAQAYGNNLMLKNSKWCIYSGDVDQNGIIDLQDMKEVDNNIGASGYLPADVNGDGIVNSLDMDIVNNNSQTFTGLKVPGSAGENKIELTPVKKTE